MKICKPQILFLLSLLIAMSVWSGIVSHRVEVVKLNINDDGDTAQVSLLHTFTAVDSFPYSDTFSYQADTTVHQTIKWVSPLQVMRINIAADGTVPDTSIDYVCSLDAGTNVYGFEYDPSGLDDTTVALIIDNLVDSINNVAGISDTVIAHDSVSYIKVISLFAQKELEGDARWTLIVVDSTQKGDSVQTTLAMISDSMTAYINADAGLDSFMTAANSGDTGYTIISDDKGVLFYATTLNHADTGGTLAASRANVTSYSTIQDTFKLAQTVFNDASHTAMYGVFILSASDDTLQGVGKSDSGYIWLYSGFKTADAIEYILLAVDTQASLPCSLRYAAAANDTLLREALYIVYRIVDTASDTTLYDPSYNFNLDYNLYEK